MKKNLCYISIIILIMLIALPPLTRIFYKEKEEIIVPAKYFFLTCSKGEYVINESYRNNEALSIKFKRPLDDENLDVYSDENALEFNLDKEIKNLVNASNEDEEDNKQFISYLLEYRNIVEDKLSGLSNYRMSIDNQITYYQSHGYNCQKVEQ